MKLTGLIIGVPGEIMEGENRVAATPETVKKMVAEGAKVLMETGAGKGSYYNDIQYRDAGAEIIESVEELFSRADLIMKVKEPLFNEKAGKHEVEMMRKGQYLLTFLHPASPVNHKMVTDLVRKGVISFTLDSIPRISKAQAMDALSSMSTVAGYKGVLLAANRLPKFMPMITSAVGMIKPAKGLIIGAGVAGLQAVATAKRLGAVVEATDIRPDACEHAGSLGAKIIDLEIPGEIAVGEGGYARELSREWLEKERNSLKNHVAEADFIILTALIPGKVAPVLITEKMVNLMKTGSVIVDIAIDQGGNCELTRPGEVIEEHGVTIYGTQNIPGKLPLSSTRMFASNIFNFITYLSEGGKISLDSDDEIISASLVTDGERIVHKGALEAMNRN